MIAGCWAGGTASHNHAGSGAAGQEPKRSGFFQNLVAFRAVGISSQRQLAAEKANRLARKDRGSRGFTKRIAACAPLASSKVTVIRAAWHNAEAGVKAIFW